MVRGGIVRKTGTRSLLHFTELALLLDVGFSSVEGVGHDGSR